MNNNIDINQLPKNIKSFTKNILKHAKFIFIIVVLCLVGFLIFEINLLINKDPTEEQITAKEQTIKRPRIDQQTIDKIEQLKDHNVAVQALFKNARNNPFQD